MTITTGPSALRRGAPVALLGGFLTGAVIGATPAALIAGVVVGSVPLFAGGLALPAGHGLLVLLARRRRRARRAALPPRTALAVIESRDDVEVPPGAGDVRVRCGLAVAPDGAPAFRVTVTQDVEAVELPAHRPGRVVVVEYPPDRPWRARIVGRPTPVWERRLAASPRPDAGAWTPRAEEPREGRAVGWIRLLGLLLAAAAVVHLSRTDLLPDGPAEGSGMSGHGYLGLWCAVFGAVALTGYARHLLGVSKARRTVRTVGRIERVTTPRHGGSPRGGIPVVVSFRDPATGEEFAVTGDGEPGRRGERITAAWVGRRIGVHYPRGRPHAYRLTDGPEAPRSGPGGAHLALLAAYAGAVAAATVERGWPWALLGFAGPWAVLLAYRLPGTLRGIRHRADGLAAMEAVPARVVAVLRNVTTDEDGHTSTTVVPVVAFTTRAGTSVTAHCATGFPDPENAYGRKLTVHHRSDDPAEFVLDPEAARRSRGSGAVADVLGHLVVLAAAVVGAVAV
ncbi:hypothetical protein [Streptomyces omiyaensis]|uniref:hypothetical protein n=1 Tax=Streptomyces omiyaensis TaxID=68247 RepID=UPI0036FBB039